VKNKEYREVQFSSSHLILIFFGILILGVVIFLLGVSVGKKQAQIIKKTEMPVPVVAEKPKETPAPSPSPEAKDLISKELASHQKVLEEAQKKVAEKPPEKPLVKAPEKATEKAPEKAAVTQKKNIFYIQVGAFDSKEVALSFARGLEKKGYSTIVLDPLPSDKRPFFRVRVGGFETREKAEEAKARLVSESKRKVDYFIIKS
jgi:cell division protein FtsN